jgi:small subunit ribosomal protein S6e
MVEFQVIVGDPETGKTHSVEVDGQHANVFVRKRIGEEVDGMFVGLPGYTVEITGGSDQDGFPMRAEIPQATRKRILVSDSVGFNPTDDGVRRKKTFRGNEISPEITQVNAKIVDRGPEDVDSLLYGEDEEDEEGEAEDETEAEGEEA